MMMMQSRKIWYYRITLIILLFAMLLAWALLPGVHEFINRSVAAFAAVRARTAASGQLMLSPSGLTSTQWRPTISTPARSAARRAATVRM